MNKKIDNPADCEVRSVISFLNAQNVRAIDIHRQLTVVYGMNKSNVRKWCRMLNEGTTNVHDEERSGRPSLITEDLIKQIDEQIRQDRRSTLDELHEKFPQISRSLMEFSTSISGTKKIVQGGCHGFWQTTTEENAWVLH
jgi:hypothetical protein